MNEIPFETWTEARDKADRSRLPQTIWRTKDQYQPFAIGHCYWEPKASNLVGSVALVTIVAGQTWNYLS